MSDPVTLAREVLGDELAWADLDPGHHPEGQAAVYRIANAAPALARATIDLTAKVEHMEALAESLDASALWAINHPDADDDLKAHAHADRVLAAQIRAILNGEAA